MAPTKKKKVDISALSTSSELPISLLPSNADIISYGNLLREQSTQNNNKKLDNHFTTKNISIQIVKAIEEQWKSAASQFVAPVIQTNILRKTSSLLEQAALIRRGKGSKEATEMFIGKLPNLFNILTCR